MPRIAVGTNPVPFLVASDNLCLFDANAFPALGAPHHFSFHRLAPNLVKLALALKLLLN